MGAVRIEFDSTLDDYVDAQILSLRQSGRFRRGMLYNALVGALIAGFLMYVVIPDVVLIRAVFGTGAGVVAALILSLSYRRTLRRNLTNISKDLRGTDGPIRTAVTMDEARIDMEWGGITVSCAWPSVRIIDQSGCHRNRFRFDRINAYTKPCIQRRRRKVVLRWPGAGLSRSGRRPLEPLWTSSLPTVRIRRVRTA
jgi:hypothetical protein